MPNKTDPATVDELLATDLPIMDLALSSQAMAVAVFALDGDLRYANPGMQMLMGLDAPEDRPAERLINPDFNHLCQLTGGGDQPIFSGIITLGDTARRTGSVRARVFRRAESLVIFGEHDVAEMDRLNRMLAEANRENNNLQRQLIKDKKRLNRTLEQLRASEAKYRRLFESAVLGIIQSTPEGRIININPAFATMFGYASTSEMLAAVKDAAADLYADPQKRPAIIQTLLSDKVPVHSENIFRRRDGSKFTGNMHKWAVRDEKGRLLYLEGFVEDIDARKKMERRLIQARKMEAVAALAGGVAHEFNNALAGLLGYLELMEMESEADPNSRDHLAAMKRTCFHMSGLAKKLLAYARGGKYRTQEATLPLALKNNEADLREVFRDGIEVEKHLEGHYPVALDTTQFGFVIKSLLINATEAIEAEGRIVLRTRDENISSAAAAAYHESFPDGRYASVAISDNGHGMDTETLQRIFDPFFSTRFPGRGLGMAAVYGIVKNHGGWIFVDSEINRGTRVKIFFPAVDAAQ
ncbi:MAG: PAS domain S-box protein [Desulfobacterales bacterium]|nr:PAS domain S-box protein [Desulfobacterales bacterium]